jgi:hypothetical protein
MRHPLLLFQRTLPLFGEFLLLIQSVSILRHTLTLLINSLLSLSLSLPLLLSLLLLPALLLGLLLPLLLSLSLSLPLLLSLLLLPASLVSLLLLPLLLGLLLLLPALLISLLLLLALSLSLPLLPGWRLLPLLSGWLLLLLALLPGWRLLPLLSGWLLLLSALLFSLLLVLLSVNRHDRSDQERHADNKRQHHSVSEIDFHSFHPLYDKSHLLFTFKESSKNSDGNYSAFDLHQWGNIQTRPSPRCLPYGKSKCDAREGVDSRRGEENGNVGAGSWCPCVIAA